MKILPLNSLKVAKVNPTNYTLNAYMTNSIKQNDTRDVFQKSNEISFGKGIKKKDTEHALKQYKDSVSDLAGSINQAQKLMDDSYVLEGYSNFVPVNNKKNKYQAHDIVVRDTNKAKNDPVIGNFVKLFNKPMVINNLKVYDKNSFGADSVVLFEKCSASTDNIVLTDVKFKTKVIPDKLGEYPVLKYNLTAGKVFGDDALTAKEHYYSDYTQKGTIDSNSINCVDLVEAKSSITVANACATVKTDFSQNGEDELNQKYKNIDLFEL